VLDLADVVQLGANVCHCCLRLVRVRVVQGAEVPRRRAKSGCSVAGLRARSSRSARPREAARRAEARKAKAAPVIGSGTRWSQGKAVINPISAGLTPWWAARAQIVTTTPIATNATDMSNRTLYDCFTVRPDGTVRCEEAIDMWCIPFQIPNTSNIQQSSLGGCDDDHIAFVSSALST